MHLFRQHAIKDHPAAAALVPVIDYGPYFAGEPDALQRLAEELRYACETVGFFYALNHGVPRTIIDRGFAASRQFHALPLEEKLRLRLNENNIGYLPMNASVQAASTVHKATKPIRTRASSSATIAAPIILTCWPESRCVDATSGPTGWQRCAPT